MESKDHNMEDEVVFNVSTKEEGFTGHPDTWFDGKLPIYFRY